GRVAGRGRAGPAPVPGHRRRLAHHPRAVSQGASAPGARPGGRLSMRPGGTARPSHLVRQTYTAARRTQGGPPASRGRQSLLRRVRNLEKREASMSKLVTLEAALAVLGAARKKAKAIGVAMNIAVVDDGGNLVAFARMD